MAIWDNWLEKIQPRPRATPPPAQPQPIGKKGNSSISSIFSTYLEGLDLIPVKLELDTAGKVQVKANSLRIPILRFVAEHEAELAQVLADLPGRKWDSMTDRVEELITRAQRMQNAG